MRLRLIAAAAIAALAATLVNVVPSDAATGLPAWCVSQNNVAIIGTSAETGYGTTGYPTENVDAIGYQPTRYGWTFRFGENLKAQWGTTVENYSHNGALATDYLPGGRWNDTTGAADDIRAKQPELVIIDLGGNEYISQVAPDTFATNLKTVVDDVKAARPDAVILMSIYAEPLWTPNPWASTKNYTWDQYAAEIFNTAVQESVALIDLRQYIPAAGSPDLPNPSPWYTDNVHLNDAGNLAEFGGFFGWASSVASLC